MTTDRRQFLVGASAAALIPGCVFADPATEAPLPPLRDRAAAKGLLFGAAPFSHHLKENKAFAETVARECNILVSGGELHMKVLRPTPHQYDFAGGDYLANFAAQHDMQFRGHALIWHWAWPEWADETPPGDAAYQLMAVHIKTLAGRYAGRMHSWDVVNEAINPWNGRDDYLRETPWFEKLGPEYVKIAFDEAAAIDPTALRVYNDYATELSTPMGKTKRRAVLKVLERWLAAGVKIQAFGGQSHLNQANAEYFDARDYAAFLREVADLGLKILITELDVSDNALPPDISLRDREVALLYRRFLDTALAEPAVIAVTTWGLSDQYTNLNWATPRSDGLPLRPLPFDRNMERKPAWYEMAAAFDRAPVRV